MPHQHVVVPPETAALLNRHDISGRLHDTQRRRVSLEIGADLTDLQLGKIAAATAVLHFGQGHLDGFRDLLGPFAIPFQQMEGHALGRLRPHPGQVPQAFNQRFNRWT